MIYAIHPVRSACMKRFTNGREFLVLAMHRSTEANFGFWKPPHQAIEIPGRECILVRGKTPKGAIIIEYQDQLYTRINREDTGYNGVSKCYTWGNADSKMGIQPYQGEILPFSDKQPLVFD